MNDIVIKVKSISKAFTSRQVLSDVNLDVTQSESVFLCGINGAGKSTLLKIIAGLLEADDGTIELCGHDIEKDPEKAKPQLGVISHKSIVYPDLTVYENLKFFAELYGVKDVRARVNELLEQASLSGFRYDRASILSRGLLQRLSIARALVNRPSILLADEPFTGLDTKSCQHLIAVLEDFSNNNGTVLMTTHDASIGLGCCKRVVLIDKQKIVFDAKTNEIDKAEFAKDYVAYAQGVR